MKISYLYTTDYLGTYAFWTSMKSPYNAWASKLRLLKAHGYLVIL